MLPGPVFASAVLVRNQETGLSLRPPPGFGEDGTWPPVATEWLPLRWELFEAGGCASGSTLMAREIVRMYRQNLAGSVDPLLAEDALDANFLDDAIFRGTSATIKVTKSTVSFSSSIGGQWNQTIRPGPQLGHYNELRRITYAVRWERKDPVIQLPPGSTFEENHSVTTGLTVEHSQNLARSLGMNVGENVVGVQGQLSSELRQEFGLKVEISAISEMAKKFTLSNTSDDQYRLFALWHVDHQIAVSALDAQVDSGGALHSTWTPLEEAEFVTANDPFITYMETARL
jgi:hypothetical protein